MRAFCLAVIVVLCAETTGFAGLFFGSNHRTVIVQQGPAPAAMYGVPLEVYSVPVHARRKTTTKVKHRKNKSTTTTYTVTQ